MRALCGIAFLFLAGCGTLGHALDDLGAVHTDPPDAFTHRFQVERFGSFGSFMRFGLFGQMLGPLRYDQRSKEEVTDPSNFCAERVRILGDSGPGSGLYTLESILWSGRILLSDPYSLSRIYAAESLEKLGHEFADAGSWDKAFEAGDPGYADRAKLLAEELSKLSALRREGKEGEEDRAKIRQDLAELAAQRYVKPAEDLAILRLLLGIAALGDKDLRIACEEAGKHLVARTIPRVLFAGLRDPNEFVREGSLVSLHQLYGRQILAESFRALRAETSPLVRRRLAKLCGELSLAQAADSKQGSALDFLLQASRDPEGSVAASAMQSLSRILGIEPRWDREFWRAWGEEYFLKGIPPEVRS